MKTMQDTPEDGNPLAALAPLYVKFDSAGQLIRLPEGVESARAEAARTWLRACLTGRTDWKDVRLVGLHDKADIAIVVDGASLELGELLLKLARPKAIRQCKVRIIIRRDSTNGQHLGTLVHFTLDQNRMSDYIPDVVKEPFAESDVKSLKESWAGVGDDAMLLSDRTLVFSVEEPGETPFGRGLEPVQSVLDALKLWTPATPDLVDADFHDATTRLLPACRYGARRFARG